MLIKGTMPFGTTFFSLCRVILFFLQKNVKDVMDSNGVRILVDLLTLAHLHTSRATVPLQVKTWLEL